MTKSRRGVAAIIMATAGAGALMGAGGATRPDKGAPAGVADLQPTSLYLQTGAFATGVPRADLGAFLAQEQGKLAGRHFVLQCTGPMRPEWRGRLADAGIALGDYLPANAFIVRLDTAAVAKAGALEFVRWFGEYRPEWKVSPEIGRRPLASDDRAAQRAAGDALVVIALFADAVPDEVVKHLAAVPGAQAHWVQVIAGNTCVGATIPLAQVRGLAQLASVQFVEEAPDLSLRNDTDRWIIQSNSSSSTPFYDHGLHGEGQVLGLLDTRLDRNHCSFSDSQPIGPLHRKILAYNAGAGAEFHGTHVAGTAVGDNGNATATRGIAYLGKVVYNTIPAFNETDMIARATTHHTQGARVHTNSWGDDGTTQYNSLCRGIDSFSYINEDDLILFAVTNQSVLKNPENAKNLVAVGASQDQPSQGSHCSGGVGPTNDQRRKPEIYAPGCNTNSASAGTSCGLTTATGTSMACPAVAGAAMLVRQYYAEGFYPSGTRQSPDAFVPSGALVKATLLNSAVDMTGIAGYPSNLEGWGRVLLDEGVYFDSDARRSFVVDVRNAQGLSTAGQSEQAISVLGSGQRLKVTLVWTEPPAAAGASFASINDLDLEVVAPNGEVFKGNVFSAGQSVTGGNRDDRNNVEQVHLQTPAVGAYTVRVRGTAINQGTQGYALVVSGDIFTPAAGVDIRMLSTVPTAVGPATALPLQISIDPGADSLVPGTAQLHYRFGPGDYQTVELDSVEGTTYSASIPPAYCGESIQFFVSAVGVETGIASEPPAGADAPFAVAVGTPMIALDHSMEVDQGWTGGTPGDTATRGVWTRVAPNAGPGVPTADHSNPGTMCFVTGQESAFGGGQQNDVDAGFTTLLSPPIDLAGDTSAVLSYWRWYNNSAGPAPGTDTLRVEISDDGGATWSLVEEVGPTGDEVVGGWIQHRAIVENLIDLTAQVRMRVVASDTGTESTVEAGVDDVRIDVIQCDGPARCPCDWDGNGVLSSQDFFSFVTAFFGGDADFNRNGVSDSQDFFDFVGCFFGNCG
jgi:hypothetical protein